MNLEDISAPRCFEIERKLKEVCDIPIFHDDQHGTAVVCMAAVMNALKFVKKDLKDCTVVFSGAGAAGVYIAKLFISLGVKDVIMAATALSATATTLHRPSRSLRTSPIKTA